MMEGLHAFCKRLPKVELHAHLNGSIRPHTLVELADERDVSLPPKFLLHEAERHDPDREALFFNTKPRSLSECFDIFACIPQCVNDLAALRRITREVLEDAAADYVAYMEIRTGPKALLRDHRSADSVICSKREYVETILEVMEEFEREELDRYQNEIQVTKGGVLPRLPLTPRLIISVDRSGTVEQAMENIRCATDMFQLENNVYIVGVELGGNPMRNVFRVFEPAFRVARDAGLPISIHCGEVPAGSSELERDPAMLRAYREAMSIIEFKPDRLGHALLLPETVMDVLFQQEHPIPIECCPTSNVMTLELALHHGGNLIDGMKSHPQLGLWIEKGYPFSINTDDSGLFCTNMTKELLLVAKANNLTETDLSKIVLNSIDQIFYSTSKSRLKKDFCDRMRSPVSEAK